MANGAHTAGLMVLVNHPASHASQPIHTGYRPGRPNATCVLQIGLEALCYLSTASLAMDGKMALWVCPLPEGNPEGAESLVLQVGCAFLALGSCRSCGASWGAQSGVVVGW